MKLKAYLEQIEALIQAHPEAAELEVFQTSCFDDPLRFETSGIYIGEMYTLDDDHFSNQDSAEERAEENGSDCEIKSSTVVVIEALSWSSRRFNWILQPSVRGTPHA